MKFKLVFGNRHFWILGDEIRVNKVLSCNVFSRRYHVKLKHNHDKKEGILPCEKCKKIFVVPYKMREHRKKCMAVLDSNVGYAHIAASLAESNELPEKETLL